MARSSRMKILIDTHVLLWSLVAPERLSATARHLISDPENSILVSHVSVWELALKVQKLGMPLPLREFLEKGMRGLGAAWLTIDLAHILETKDLPPVHGDPFDRMLIAQAISERVPVVSGDTVFSRYPLSVIW
ncbi:MAG TPA: type II toxin-antitoxin system VapC family toxin [Terriglobales bacterium]|nr:type II toxin-antitoxin system VapC family toxin [Terriglobales bacterium]